MIRTTLAIAAAAVLAGAMPASATFIISKKPTQNVSCSNGLCVPTAGKPNLNVGDLEALLAAGSVEINSHSGKIHAGNILVKASFAWSAATTLTLDESFIVDKPISVDGSGGVILSSYRDFRFGLDGRIQCADLSCNINGYTAVNTLQGLASAIAENPDGEFALVRSYDASADGTYASSPVGTNFLGALEGLGNTISNISVNNTTACCVGGIFQNLSDASISDLRLKNVVVASTGGAAGFAYESFGKIKNVSLSGTVTGSGSSGDMGGLVADNYNDISGSSSSASVSVVSTIADIDVGGLVGADYGSISRSFATGNVSVGDGAGNVGGLAGLVTGGGSIENSYANGAVAGGANATVGGLLGKSDYAGYGNLVISSYSIGAVSAGSGSIVGGFIGENDSIETAYDYWDTTTSGTNVGVGIGNASGITGLTTEQLQSGLPPGFYTRFWRESADINGGLPYLKQNPAAK